MELTESFINFLKSDLTQYSYGEKVLLAVSGGLDSMVMSHLFHAAGLPFAIAHCNFQLRGEAAVQDAVFTETAARHLKVPFYQKTFDTAGFAAENKISTQMAARTLRYAWFADVARAEGYTYLATAHHQNDSVETVLLNLVRGGGLAGLQGIRPQSQWNNSELVLLRPLLSFSRAQLEAYAQAQGIEWREDQSNSSDDYTRNAVRHHIVPALEALNPAFVHTAGRNAARVSQALDNLQYLLRHFLLEGTENDANWRIDKQRLAALPSPTEALRLLLRPRGFDTEQARQLAENLEDVGLELKGAEGYRALVDRQYLLVFPKQEQQAAETAAHLLMYADDLMLKLPDGAALFMMSNPDPHPDWSKIDHNCIYVNATDLQFPLHLRRWQEGDVFQPLGMDGKSQKLQDFFTNRKLSRAEKEAVWLLTDHAGQIIWVVGYRPDERFKVEKHTQNVLKFNFIR